MVVDALLLCFCEDCKMNDGDTKPYYMNESLMVCILFLIIFNYPSLSLYILYQLYLINININT